MNTNNIPNVEYVNKKVNELLEGDSYIRVRTDYKACMLAVLSSLFDPDRIEIESHGIYTEIIILTSFEWARKRINNFEGYVSAILDF